MRTQWGLDFKLSAFLATASPEPGGGHEDALQYSCLENPTDRGAWWATVHGVAKSQTRLKQLSTHTRTPEAEGGPAVPCGWLLASRSVSKCSDHDGSLFLIALHHAHTG